MIKSTILAAGGGGSCGIAFGETITDAGYNISDDSTCGFAKTGSANNGDNIDPLLSPAGLADNGGPTQTIALQSKSPAIDAIPIASCADQASPPNPITTDQRAFPRPDAKELVCDTSARMSSRTHLPLRDSLVNRTATARACRRSITSLAASARRRRPWGSPG